MKTDYSKPSADIALETRDWQAREQDILEWQRSVSRHLHGKADRTECLLCGAGLERAEQYRHRQTDYVICPRCTHVQSRSRPPAGYPHAVSGTGFEAVYPDHDRRAYASRRDRIYAPKLEWALSRMDGAGLNVEDALRASWLELGCGAGYFLDALRRRGASNCFGLDDNEELVSIARDVCGADHVQITTDLLGDLAASEAKIIAAFFVLEHLDEPLRFWRVMSEKRAQTVCLFAVPTLGFSTILEGALDGFAARNLDSVLHTQLYTDRSIDFALEMSGYEKVAEWLFGQDASDLFRLLVGRLTSAMSGPMGGELGGALAGLVDSLQATIDHARLCDARHVLAVKR